MVGPHVYENTAHVQLASCFLAAEHTQIAPKNTVEVNTCPLEVSRMSPPFALVGFGEGPRNS